MSIQTRAPAEAHRLNNGDILAFKPGTHHTVVALGIDGCQFMIVQGVGVYDYVPVYD